MARIVIEDLPILEDLSREEMASIVGGSFGGDVDVAEVEVSVQIPTGTASS